MRTRNSNQPGSYLLSRNRAREVLSKIAYELDEHIGEILKVGLPRGALDFPVSSLDLSLVDEDGNLHKYILYIEEENVLNRKLISIDY
jgi:hypothetical protein